MEFLAVKNKFLEAGLKFLVAADSNNLCRSDRSIVVCKDIGFQNVHINNFESIIFIGGESVKEYWHNHLLHNILIKANSKGLLIAAICNSVFILGAAGVLKNKNCTFYSKSINELKSFGAIVSKENLVVDANIITANGPEAADEFANQISLYLTKCERN